METIKTSSIIRVQRNIKLLVLSSIVFVSLYVFIDKPLLIDEDVYLDLSLQLKFFPFGAFETPFYSWKHIVTHPLEVSHPILVPYFIKLISFFLESTDLKYFHVFFIFFPVLTCISVFFLASKFNIHPFKTALLFFFLPVTFIMAQSIMTDIPTLALNITAIAFFIYGIDDNRKNYFFYSGIFYVLAIFSSYQSLSIILIFICYVLLFSNEKQKHIKYSIIILFSGIVILFLWFLINLIILNISPLDLLLHVSKENILREGKGFLRIPLNFLYLFISLTGVTLFPILFYLFFLYSPVKKQVLAIFFIISLLLSYLILLQNILPVDTHDKPNYFLLFFLLFTSFNLLFWLLMRLYWCFPIATTEQKLSLFLLFWFFLEITVYAILAPTGTARYILPALLPLLLLIMIDIKRIRIISNNFLVSIILIINIPFALTLGVYDYVQYKSYASQFIKILKDTKSSFSSENYWIYNESTLKYYAEKEGYIYFFNQNYEIKPPNILISDHPLAYLPQLKGSLEFEKIKTENLIISNILTLCVFSGFYNQAIHPLPYLLKKNFILPIFVYKIIETDLIKVANQTFHNLPAGEITKKNIIGQTFISKTNNLSVIKILLASYARQNTTEIIFHLREYQDGKDRDIVKIVVPASKIKDNSWQAFHFPPLSDSKGKTYYFYLESPNAIKGNAFTTWMSSGDEYKEGTFLRNHLPEEGDLAFIALAEKKIVF